MAVGTFGTIHSEKNLVSFTGTAVARTSCAHVTGDVSCAVFGDNPATPIKITLVTFTINSSTGAVSNVLDTEVVKEITSTASAGHVMKLKDGIVIVAVNNETDAEIQIYSFSIASDGTITAVDSLVSAVASGMAGCRPTPVRITDTLIAVAYINAAGDRTNTVITIDVDSSGNLGSIQDTQAMPRAALQAVFGIATIGIAKVREPDIWSMGQAIGGSTGDTDEMSFTIDESNGTISAQIDSDVFDVNGYRTDFIVSFLPGQTDGQFIVSATREHGTETSKLVSYQSDNAADIGNELDTEVIAISGDRHGAPIFYLGNRVVLHQRDTASTKKTWALDSNGVFSDVDNDSASSHSPAEAYFMHPPGFGNKMVMSYSHLGDIYISVFDVENLIPPRQRSQAVWFF